MNAPACPARAAVVLAVLALGGAVPAAADAATEAVATQKAAAEQVTFRYAPAAGTTYTETVVTKRAHRTGAEPLTTDVARVVNRIVVSEVPQGRRLRVEKVSSETTRNGQPVDNPFEHDMGGLLITLTVGPDGELLDVKGYAEVERRLATKVPPELLDRVRAQAGEDVLVQRAKSEWDSRITGLVGETVRVGEVRETESRLTVPGGASLRYLTRTSFPGFEPCGEARCLRVESTFDSSELEQAAGTPKGASFDGKLTRLLEPDTLLIHHEHLEQTLVTSLARPGGEVVDLVVRDERTHSYEY